MKHPERTFKHFRSPKLNSKKDKRKSQFFNYYAGYSEAFVEDVLDYLKLDIGKVILDPWNGSGTTTYVAEKKGFKAIGYDINPVMPLVASARRVTNIDQLSKCLVEIISKVKRLKSKFIPLDDPLKDWLGDNSIALIRRIERAIQQLFLSRKNYLHAKDDRLYHQILSDPIISFFYVSLFRTVKELLTPFRSSNPTWVKTPKTEADKLEIEIDTILACFTKNAKMMIESVSLKSDKFISNGVTLGIASSRAIPINDSSIDAVITSPPYCTRIDYVIKTRIELAILGYGYDKNFEKLRSQMIGTIKIVEDEIVINDAWGKTALGFLHSVRNHESKASRTYYNKQYLQYFHGMYLSLLEINRIIRSNGYVAIVVQDSYYKDIHLNLPKVFFEMATSFGWKLVHSQAFYQEQTFAIINKGTKKYRNTSSAVETALVFQKSSGRCQVSES